MKNIINVLSWNIQNCRGCDGKISPSRVVETIKASSSQLDVICLQEIARFFPEYCDDEHPDQLSYLMDAFPEYTATWGASLSWPLGETHNQRREFGNLTLSKLPLLDKRIHCLPMGNTATSYQTPRVAVETLLQVQDQALCIINTHLAFHCSAERAKQLEHLTQLKEQYESLGNFPPEVGVGIYSQPFQPNQILLCGDLNFSSESELYSQMIKSGWMDAASTEPPQPTCGIFDHDQWPEGAHRRDYAFLSTAAVTFVDVDQQCQASDHQPLLISLEQ